MLDCFKIHQTYKKLFVIVFDKITIFWNQKCILFLLDKIYWKKISTKGNVWNVFSEVTEDFVANKKVEMTQTLAKI